jgi:hypothetical protein
MELMRLANFENEKNSLIIYHTHLHGQLLVLETYIF